MADLSGVHRYAAGGLFALALSQAQFQQRRAFAFEMAPDANSNDQQESGTSIFDEPWTSWCSPEHGLLRHIFRFIALRAFLIGDQISYHMVLPVFCVELSAYSIVLHSL